MLLANTREENNKYLIFISFFFHKDSLTKKNIMGRLMRRCKDSSGCKPIDEFCDPAVDRCSPCEVRCRYKTENDKECIGSCPEYYKRHILVPIPTATTNEDTPMKFVESTSLPSTWGGELFTGDPKRSTEQYEGWKLALAISIPCLVCLVVVVGILVKRVLYPYIQRVFDPYIKQLRNRPDEDQGTQGPASQASTEDPQDSLLGPNHQQSPQTASPPQAAGQSEQLLRNINEHDTTGSGSITILSDLRQDPSNNDTCYSGNSIPDIPSFAMPEDLNLKEDTPPKRPDPVDESKLKPGRSIPSTNNCNSSFFRDPMISG